MIQLTLAILLGLVGTTGETPARDGLAIGERLVAAIKGKAEFQDSDFEKQLVEADKAALRRLADCNVRTLGHAAYPTEERNVLERNFDHVVIEFGCSGVSLKTPVGIFLHLHDGKIATLELKNADLMRVD